ncbi:MAG: hypothetical protein ACXIUM_12025 [Wenzhouxiangella sp.]
MSTAFAGRQRALVFCQCLLLALILGACERSEDRWADDQAGSASRPVASASLDAASLAGEVGADPEAWLTELRRTPAVSATDAWSCVCAWTLQQGDLDQVSAWLAQLAGFEQLPERSLTLDEAEEGMPPHYGRASNYGAAVAGCLIGLHGLAEHDATRARELIEALAAASDQTLPPDWPLRLDRPSLLESFWPSALEQHQAARQVFLAQWRPPAPRLECQREVSAGWAEVRP